MISRRRYRPLADLDRLLVFRLVCMIIFNTRRCHTLLCCLDFFFFSSFDVIIKAVNTAVRSIACLVHTLIGGSCGGFAKEPTAVSVLPEILSEQVFLSQHGNRSTSHQVAPSFGRCFLTNYSCMERILLLSKTEKVVNSHAPWASGKFRASS